MIEESFYHRESETQARAARVESQNKKLCRLIQQLATNRFYLEKFHAVGIDPAQVQRFEDLRALPSTTKNELVEEQRAHPPFGRNLTYPLAAYRYFHQTSGTTGQPLKWLDTDASWAWWAQCWGYVYRGAGVTERDIVFCAFSFGPYISHWAAIEGARLIGALTIAGGGMTSEQRLQAILSNQCTVLVCTPTYALHLAETARQLGLDLRQSGIRVSIHAGEPGASVPNVKRSIEEAWGSICFDHAGATEVGAWAFGCKAEAGAIHLNENEFIFEVIDSNTGDPVAEGQRGELVITNLGRAGMPVLRYRTGDLVEMTTAPCSCGRTLARIRGGVLGRADDMLIVRGVNLYPSVIDNLIRSVAHIVEYEVEIHRIAGMDDLLVKIETADSVPFEKVKQSILDACRHHLNLRVRVEQAALGSLPRYEFKARRYKRISEPALV